MSIAQCLSFSFVFLANLITNVKIPLNYDIDMSGTTITIKELTCPYVVGGSTGFYYNSTGISIEVFEAMNLSCILEIDVNRSVGAKVVADIISHAGEALIINTTADEHNECYSAEASVNTCSLAPTITSLRLDPPNMLLDILIALAVPVINGEIKKAICQVGSDIATQVTNTTMLPLSPFPPFHLGALPVHDWALGNAITTIAHNLPPRILGVHIAASEPNPTGMTLNISVPEAINITTEHFSLFTPANVLLSVDVGLDFLICKDSGLLCVISNGLKLPNVRTWGGGQMDRLMNNVISPLLTNGFDKSFSKGVPINIYSEEAIESPPMWAIILLGPLVAMMAVATIAFSILRHSRRPTKDIHGNPISLRRVLIEDVFVTAGCFTCIYLFAWSNATTAASVIIGNEVTVYTFSLVNSVRDMWLAGLYPLSVLIAIFSGVYPYVKLLAIVTYSVILQQPQNKVLRIVDNVGKYSLLDSFVMTILKTGLEINGIATVKCHLSFYMFVFATLGSMCIGNYATHGWRRQTSLRYDDHERELIIKRTIATRINASRSNAAFTSPTGTGAGFGATNELKTHIVSIHEGYQSTNYASCGDNPLLDDENTTANNYSKNNARGSARRSSEVGTRNSKRESKVSQADVERLLISDKGFDGIDALDYKWYDTWEWRLALPLGILIGATSGVACRYPSLVYKIAGIATLLTGTEKPCSLWDLFFACDTLLLLVGLVTVIFAPFVYIITYPHARFLAVWGATDVFLLACVTGLLQLKQFIDFTLGEGMESVYSATCELKWPLALWALSVLVQWFFTFKQTLGIPGWPTLEKIKLAMALRSSEDSSCSDSEEE